MAGEVYVLKAFQSLGGINILNVYYYRLVSGSAPDPAEELFTAFDGGLLDEFIDCVSENLSINNVEIFEIATPTEFFSAEPTNNQGTRTDTVANRMPTFNAFSYKTNRAGAGTRSSYKRYCGLLEEDVGGNALSASFKALAAVVALQSAIGDNLISSGGNEYEPVQVKSGWSIGVTPVVNFVIEQVQPATLSSQVSRK